MNVWRCPKCGYTTEQPPHVTGMTHRCKPNNSRHTYRLVPDPPQTHQGDTET